MTKLFTRHGNLCVFSVLLLICAEIVLVVFIFGSWPVVRLSANVGKQRLNHEYQINVSLLGQGPHSSAMEKIIAQRNSISRQLNSLKQQLGQAECKGIASNERESTSTSGGWCENESKENGGKHLTDKYLAEALAKLLKGKRVASFGDGPGRYKAIIDSTDMLVLYDAFDGAPFCDVTSQGRVKFLDLTIPQYGLPVYDYVISLEVAEHIPAEFEHIFVDNLVRHAREGIVLSWAKIGQQGFKHVNNKAFEDVRAILKRYNFEHDENSSNVLKEAATLTWLEWNTNVFKRMQGDNISTLYMWT